MGKPKDWRGNGSKQTWEATADRSWSIWPGAFSPQAPWKPRGGKGAQKEQGIPGYATRRPQEEQPNPAAPTNGASAKEGLVPTIQHALNYTRKAEARVKKVQDDKIKHVQMWQLWEADMKAAWLREKKRFAAEAERLEKEAGESLQAQADARCNLRAAFEACYRPTTETPGAMEVEDAANSAEWEATMAGWNQEAQPDWSSMLQRAYGEVTPARKHVNPLTPRPVRTASAPMSGPRAAPGPAFSTTGFGDLYMNLSMNAIQDPYQAPAPGASPVQLGPCGSIPHGLAPTAPMAMAGDPSDKTGPLPSSTTTAEQGYGPSPVQERLNRRRALEPFGGRPVPMEAMSEAASTGTGHKVFVEDDPDEIAGAAGPPNLTREPGGDHGMD